MSNPTEPSRTPSSLAPATPFTFVKGELSSDGVPFRTVAERHGTPLYVYSLSLLLANYDRIARAFAAADPLIAFAVKANGNLAILRALAKRGSGFDIVSVGELERAAAVGAEPRKVIFAGVGKRADEIRRALQFGVGQFNIESPGEAELIDREAAAQDVKAPVALRLNPDVDPHTHEYISTGRKENKFGINMDLARELVNRIRALPNLRLVGLHAHIGSQILDPSAHNRAVTLLEDFALSLQSAGIPLETLNMGGGFGIDYESGTRPLPLEAIAGHVVPVARRLGLKLVLEPGRFVIAAAGVLLVRVLYVKHGTAKTFVIVDGSMTDLIRPSLYGAYHRVVPVRQPEKGAADTRTVDVVGPVCETTDFLARDRWLPDVQPGDLLAVLDAGAYGMVMASNYNARPRPAEVLLAEGHDHLIRHRDTVEEIITKDIVPDFLRNGT